MLYEPLKPGLDRKIGTLVGFRLGFRPNVVGQGSDIGETYGHGTKLLSLPIKSCLLIAQQHVENVRLLFTTLLVIKSNLCKFITNDKEF